MPKPWEVDWGQSPGPVYGPPPSRSKMRAEDRADRSEARSDINSAVSNADTAHDNRKGDIDQRLSNPQALRKEYGALPEVRSYTTAAQQLAQALNTGDGPQADLALTYAFAKAMDPDSVVREAEQGMVTSSQPWLQAAVENAKKQFGMDGAGNYTPEARAAIRQQIIRSVATRRNVYELARQNFADQAGRNNIDAAEVIGPHVGEAYREQARQYDTSRRKSGANVGYPTGSGMGGMVGGMLGNGTRTAPRKNLKRDEGWWGQGGGAPAVKFLGFEGED